jgi:hypothetical protein
MPNDSDRYHFVPIIELPALKLPFYFWNRLEPRSRADDFSRSIQAKIRDPLWMLTRQWQFGEFRGEDAASPVNTYLSMEKTRLTRFSPGLPGSGSTVSPNPENIPLETVVERQPITLKTDIRLRVQIGQQLERELKKQQDAFDPEKVKEVIKYFKAHFAIEKPSEDEMIAMDDVTTRFMSAVLGRVIDGEKLNDAGYIVADPNFSSFPEDELNDIANKGLIGLYEWYTALYGLFEQNQNPAWHADELEYVFSVAAPDAPGGAKQQVLNASDYNGENLDWYGFSIHHDPEARLGADEEIADNEYSAYEEDADTLIPAQIRFHGMPNSRWWEFEDRVTDFGDLDVNVTDLGKLLVMEFALIHSNDWFIIPIPLKVGSLCRVKSLVVTDVFGLCSEIKRAGSGVDDDWQRAWNMFSLSVDRVKDFTVDSDENQKPIVGDFLFLPPALGRSEESPYLEDVRFLRDEMANMAWALEHTIQNGLSSPVSGFEYHRDRIRKTEEKVIKDRIAIMQEATEALGDVASAAAEAVSAAAEATTPESLASHAEEAAERLREAAEAAGAAVDEFEIESEGDQDSNGNDLIKYRLTSSVPANWIPYITIHTDNKAREIQFQRAAMLDPSDIVGQVVTQGKSLLLRHAGTSHRINEEAVSRAGTSVRLCAQRARWIDGSTHLWFGHKTGPGRGEGSSGLRFDYFEE